MESSGLRANRTQDNSERRLDFFYCNRALLADFNAAFAAQALILVDSFSLTIDQFVYVNGAYIYTFSVASALVLVNCYFEAHFFLHLGFENLVTNRFRNC